MADYKVPPKPMPDMDAGRSATPVSDAMTGGGQMSSDGSMGKSQKTGDMMPEGSCGHDKKK